MTVEEPIRLVLVEDHVAVRQGMELLLGRRGHVISAAAGDAREGYERIRAVRPDVAVVDVSLPDESGPDLTRRLLRDDSALRVLLYTGLADEEAIGEALDCGAQGVALKSGTPHELIEAIRTLSEGGTYMDPRLGSRLRRSATGKNGLSGREREIMDLLAKGLTGAEVAERLFLSPDTVRTHVKNAMAKLEANTRAHAVALALLRKEIPLREASYAPEYSPNSWRMTPQTSPSVQRSRSAARIG